MTIPIFSAKTIPARWYSPVPARPLVAAAPALMALGRLCLLLLLPTLAAPSPLATLVHAYRESPTPAHLSAIQTYITSHPQETALANLALGVTAYEQKNYAAAIPLLVPASAQLPQIADYAGYYLAATRVETADFAAVHTDLAPTHQNSPLNGKAWILEARAKQSSDAAAAARLLMDHYSELPQPDGDVTLGDCYRAVQDTAHAAEAYQRVYSHYLTGDAAARAEAALTAMQAAMGSPAQLLQRADLMADAKDYPRAKREYQSLAGLPAGLERDQARVRIGAMDFLRGQVALACPYFNTLELSPSEAEAERVYYTAECARQKKDDAAMMAAVERLAHDYPHSTWRLKALCSAANRYLLVNRPADYVPLDRTIYQEFPTAPQAAMAHWKVAFQAYLGNAPDAVSLLREHLKNYFGNSTIGASLYFLGRLLQRSGELSAARACYQRLASSFENHYYAMQARERLRAPEIASAAMPAASAEVSRFLGSLKFGGAAPVPPEPTPPTTARIQRSRTLRSAGLDDLADSELRYGWRSDGQPSLLAMEMASTASSPYLAMKVMKAMSPEYLNLPVSGAPRLYWEMLFPLPYKSDVVRTAQERSLDPFLVAGLIRQESEFNPRAISPAKAYGLTQVRPASGRLVARKAGVARVTVPALYQPAVNLKLGTLILRTMLDQQNGSIEQTLAAYNAGPNRVAEWRTWASFREPAEFIETIPFTETRDYVQAVLRNAEMYRRLYQ
jgi:soluble lytic murein transglycosylase